MGDFAYAASVAVSGMIGVVLWTVMTVRRSGELTGGGGGDGGEGGARETVGSSSRDPIRRDEKRVEFERLTGEVRRGLVAPEWEKLIESRGPEIP